MWRVSKSQIFLQEMKGIHEEYVKNVYEQAKNMLTYSGLFT